MVEDFHDEILLKDFKQHVISEFRDDFSALISMIKALDAAWAEADNELYAAMDIFKEYVENFNKKYPGLKVNYTNNLDQGFRLFIFFTREKNLVDLFNNAAGKIHGLIKVGTTSEDAERPTFEILKEVLVKIHDKMFLLYHSGNSQSLILSMDHKEKLPELIYSMDTIDKDDSAEFLLCAYYALKEVDEAMELKPIRLKFPSIVKAPGVSNVGALKG